MAAAASIKEAKSLLRKELKRRLFKMSEEVRKRESVTVTQKLLSMKEYQASERISVYMSMPNEVNTMDIMKNIFETKKKCFIPYYKGTVMKMVPLASMEDYNSLPLTSWNIKQPADDDVRDDALQTGGLDLIVVPGLGFTKDGARLGRGKGYYDNYITKCHQVDGNRPITISLAYSTQLCDEIPMSDHDMYIDHVLYTS